MHTYSRVGMTHTGESSRESAAVLLGGVWSREPRTHQTESRVEKGGVPREQIAGMPPPPPQIPKKFFFIYEG